MEVGQAFRPFERFHGIMVPEELCRYSGIGPGEKLCWGRLARYEGKNGRAFPSIPTLGRELGVSARQARSYVEKLERQGFIRREHIAGKTNRFVFLWHPVFEEPRKNPSAPPRQHSSAPPRKDPSSPGGRILPPKRVSEESRRQESHSEESQFAENCANQVKGDDDNATVYASDKDELIALIRESTGQQPDARLVRQVPEFVELRGGTLRRYLDDIRPRLKRLRNRPTEAFFYRHAERWGGDGSRPAPEPKPAESLSEKCLCKFGQIKTPDGWEVCQNCGTGRDLARANAKLSKEQADKESQAVPLERTPPGDMKA